MTTNKAKVIMGLALAAIMLASVMLALVLTGSAVSKGENFNYIGNITTPVQNVLIGQNVQFNATEPSNNWANPSDVVVYRYVAGNLETTYGPYSGGTVYNVNWPPGGAYYASDNPSAPQSQAQLSVQYPSIPLTLKVGEKVVSIIAVGTRLRVDTSGINLFDEDKVDLEIIGPDGQIIVNPGNPTQIFRNITVATLKEYGSTDTSKQIDTSAWKLGSYTFQVKTKPLYACGLNAQSAVNGLTITKGEIDVSAEKTFCAELETIKLIVTGAAGDPIEVKADPSSPHVLFVGGVEDTPIVADGKDHFTHVIDEDGKRIYAVRFNWTGTYTIKVTVTSGPRADDYDTVDIIVTEKAVIFDVPSTVVIGEKFMIKGMANTGSYVTIAVDDYVYPELDRLVIAVNGEFEKEIDTSTPGIPPFTVPGCVNLRAFIDRHPVASYPEKIDPNETDDGSALMSMLETHLDATLSKATVYPGDSFEVYGNASSNYVEIVAITPKGGNGTGMDGLYGTTIYTVPTFCNFTNYNFYKKIKVDNEADNGNYTILVLSPDGDEIYGHSSFSYIDSILDLDGAGPELGAIDVSNKTQEEIVAIVEDIIYAAGSDDFMWVGYIMVTLQKPPPVSVTRDLPDAVSLGAEFEVSLTQSGFYFTGSVTETLPEGFSYEGVLSGGTLFEYDETTNDLTMDFQGGATTLIYKVKAGTAEQIENAVFSGTWNTVDSQMNKISGSIGGETTLTLAEPTPIFDTGAGTYPSIFGTHNGTITPYHNINVSKIYTYSCPGTGGHTEYVAFYNATTGEEIANGTWNGYQGAGDYHYIIFEKSFMLKKEVTYNYTVKTGSYPQIHHTDALLTPNGWINCTEFLDVNGKRYTNWIPAIKLH